MIHANGVTFDPIRRTIRASRSTDLETLYNTTKETFVKEGLMEYEFPFKAFPTNKEGGYTYILDERWIIIWADHVE